MPTIRSSADLRNLSNRFLFLCDNFRFHNTFQAINPFTNLIGLYFRHYQTLQCVNKFHILS